MKINEIYCEDCRETMKRIPDNSVGSVVTDPPYGISFMGKKWDYDVPGVDIWKECFRILKPGGYLLSFASTRTQHRMACNIEDAGFKIRDMIMWVYGSGFPKSLDISKQLDKMAGAEREVVGKKDCGYQVAISRTRKEQGYRPNLTNATKEVDITIPTTPEVQQWQGYGTALKPALEPITVARKPISEKNIASNVLKWGTGGINIDGCRIETDEKLLKHIEKYGKDSSSKFSQIKSNIITGNKQGRFPANFIHDGSQEVMQRFPNTKSIKGTQRTAEIKNQIKLNNSQETQVNFEYSDKGSAARFFYCAKASKAERGEGNTHPTVKPIALMRYLIRLVTPPKEVVYDPFIGSGTTAIAATIEGFWWIGSEKDSDSVGLANNRIKLYLDKPTLF